MANRYSNRSQRDQERGQNFGGSRRNQNLNEYGGSRTYGGGRNFNESHNDRQENQRDFTQGGNYGQDFSSGNMRTHFGGGSRGNFGSNRDFEGRNFGDDREGRYDVGRDFMTNQPFRENYGQMDDSRFGQNFGGRSSGDYGSSFSGYSGPSRDFSERGGYSGSTYGSYGSGYGSSYDRDDDRYNRTNYDESIAGRPYFGSGSSDYDRQGWRGYGSRPGNMGFGDRERPDSWNRQAYSGSERGSFGQRHEPDFFNTTYGSTQHGNQSQYGSQWRSDRDRGDYTGSGFYRNDYDRNRWDRDDRDEESFGDKVKNFFGVGPKGYKRSDDRIREDVSERLEDHPQIDASNIEVQVLEAEVTLTGSTPNRLSKRLAEDVAERVRGVKDVHNQVRVSQSGDESSLTSTGRTSSVSGSTTGTQSGTGTTGTAGKKGSERAA